MLMNTSHTRTHRGDRKSQSSYEGNLCSHSQERYQCKLSGAEKKHGRRIVYDMSTIGKETKYEMFQD
jgi:hypothetical protein